MRVQRELELERKAEVATLDVFGASPSPLYGSAPSEDLGTPGGGSTAQHLHAMTQKCDKLEAGKRHAENQLRQELQAAAEVNSRCETLCAAALRAKEEIFSLRQQLDQAKSTQQGSAMRSPPMQISDFASVTPPPPHAASGSPMESGDKQALQGQISALREELVHVYQWLTLKREREEAAVRSITTATARVREASQSPSRGSPAGLPVRLESPLPREVYREAASQRPMQFDTVDRNKDGVVDRSEFRTAYKEAVRQEQGARAGNGGQNPAQDWQQYMQRRLHASREPLPTQASQTNQHARPVQMGQWPTEGGYRY